MSTKGRENWEKYKAGYVSTRLAEEVSTGNAGRDRWNELKKTIRFDKPESTQNVVSGSGAQAEKKSFLQRAGLTVSGGAKGSLAGNMDAMGVAYELGQSGRTQRYTEELREAQWAVARAKHDYDADPNNWQTKDALDTALTKMKGFADTLGKGAYEQALTAAYDAASKFETEDLKALYNGLGVVDPEQGTGVQQQAASAARDLAYGVQESASKDLQEAKEGASKFGQMLVDAGASMTQMGIDSAVSGLMGFRPTKWNGGNKILQEALGIGEKVMTPGAMIPFAARAFGGSTMDARQDGADLKGQVLYGGAQAAKEVFTEKMFNIALPFAQTYGKGGLDSVVKNGIRKAAEKLGKSDVGRAALERVLKFGASAASEGLEEFVGDFFEWQMPRIYGGDTDSFAETFSNALYDFAVGTISGAAGGAVESGVDLYNDHAQAREAKKVYGDQAQDIVNESKELAPDNKLAEKYQKKLDKGGKLTGFQLMRIMQQNENGIVEQDKQKIQTATEDRLKSMGETADVKRLAEVIAKRVAGEDISKAEHKLLYSESKYGRRLMSELNPDVSGRYDKKSGEMTDGISTDEWTGRLGTRLVNPITYNRSLGVTGAKYNPETGKLDAIVTDAEGKVETKPLQEAEPSPLQEELFDWSDSLKLKEAGPLMINAYRQEQQNVELYARSFKLAYEYGKAGMPMDYVEKSEGVSYLSDMQRTMAYEEGQKAAQQAYEEAGSSSGTASIATAKKPSVSLRGATVGGTTYAPVNRKTVDARQWASVKAMRAFSKVTGIDVVFYQSQANEKGEYEGANGFYKDGTLYLDINAGRDTVGMTETAVLKTAAHELTHFIQQNSRQYEELKKFVVERLVDEEGVSFEDLVTDKQRRESGLDYNEAVDEVVADACEMMLKDSTAAEQLVKENRSLARKIRDWLREWVENLKNAMEGLTADRPESRAMMQYAQELQKLWDNALVDAARNGRGTESKTRYSYSGVRAKTANRSALQKAVEMRNQEKSNEEIRKETGWFVGMDGKWRFEISDADIRFDAEGDLQGKNKNDVKTLADYISHDKLFEAYPQLRDIEVRFEKDTGDVDGAYSPGVNEIVLKTGLKLQPDVLKNVLVHEIQHAIQEQEDFARGASPEYWAVRDYESGDKVSERLQKQYDDVLNGLSKTEQNSYIRYMELERELGNLFLADENSEDGKRYAKLEAEQDRLYEKLYPNDWFRRLIDLDRRIGNPGEEYYRLYRNTAGEIEARDSSARRTLTEEERRKKAPDLGDENTVYADNAVAFYAKDAMGSKAASVKEQLKESRDTLNRLPPVTIKTVVEDIEKLSAAQRYEWAIRELKASGYRVERVDGSVITFEPKDINSGLRYLNTAGEIAAYTALPAVLKRGIVIHENPNHKGRGYGTVTYAAPVEINGVRGNMAVVVRQTNGNRYDVHRIVMPDGAAFEFKKKANAVPTSAGGITDIAKASGGVDPAINTASKRSIRQTTENSQEKSSDKVQNQQRDYSYEALTSKPDMQVTMVDDTANYAAGSEARKNVIARAIAAAKKVGSSNENGNSVIHVDDMDTNVILSAKGLRHGLDRRFSVNAPVTLKAGEILKNAIRINELTPKKDTIDASYVLIGAAKNVKNEPYIVQFVVNRASNEVTSVDVLHSIGAKKEPAALLPEITGVPATLTGSSISISSLLDYVNRYFPDVLPESVLKHYGHDARPAGELGANALFQQRELRLSDRAVLLWAAEKAVSEKSKRWSTEDLNRFDLLVKKLKGLDEAYAELEALKEERTAQLAGRKEAELKKEERFELNQTKNRIQTQKDKIQRLEADTYRIESIPQMKELLRKSRSIVEAEASYKARREYIERREAQEEIAVTRRKVERNAKRLTEYMTTNTDKKHIPEALKKPIGELLESLDFSAKKSGRATRADLKYIEAMQDLQAALAAQRLFDDTGEGTDLFKGYMDLPAGFESLLAVHVEKVKNALENHPLKTGLVRAMDIDDLKELDVILSVMSRSVTRMNEMFVNRRFALVSEAAENSIDTMSELGQHQDKTGERFMLWDNTLPWYAFQRFGEGGKAVFEGLQDGWDKLAFNMKTVLDFRKDLIKDALARKWDTEKHRVELTDPDGATVTAVLTTAQLMSLHCLSKRKQALGHLLGGGIRPSAIELTDSIGDRIKKRSLNQDKQFKLTEESLAHLLGLLTPEQVKIADAMQKFMTEQGSLWGNEVTMIRFGYRGFTEQNYFPIETDAQDRQAKTGDTKDGSLYRLQNISAVKPLVKNANNALVLRGIFDVFANHTADMAKYNALVLPILDAQKWYNYKYASKNEAGQVSTRTVQRAMTKAYGGAANNYVIKYLQDLNGVKESGDRGDTLAKKMISNYKRAMVAANMRVALLQPTAYARASAVLDYEYLAKAFADKTSTKQATEEMLQHSGIALWKSLGFFDTDVGRSIRDQIKGKSSKLENFVDKTMVPAEKGDEITWARLWRACKLEVQDKQKLTGDELLKATAERFREVVYRTQVVDSTMTRSHTMRSNGTLSKMATSFMSEPTVSYNMVMESTRQTVGDAKRMGMRVAIRRNWKALGRSLQAYVMSAAVTAIVESLYDALRDPDDDEYMEKVWKAFGGEKPETAKDQVLSIIFGLNGNFAGDINPIGKVPYLRDVVSILGGYSNGRMDTEAVANLKKAIDIWDEVIRLKTGDLDKATKTTYYGNMTTYGMIYPTAKALSQLTGLPGSAAMREVATAWNTTVGTVWPALKMRTYEDKKLREAWENYGKDSGVSYAVMYRAIQELKEFESDRDADGNAISGSLKAKYVEYIRGMSLTRAQEKAVWEAAKNSSWSDKGTPWG